MNCFQLFQNKLYQISKLMLYVGLFALSSMSFQVIASNTATASHHQDQKNLALALKLENHFWTLVQEQKMNKLFKLLAPNYQALNISGIYSRNRKQQVDGLTGVKMKSFTIVKPFATRHGNVINLSYKIYFISGPPVIDSINLSTWNKFQDGWKMVSHSYVPLPSSK